MTGKAVTGVVGVLLAALLLGGCSSDGETAADADPTPTEDAGPSGDPAPDAQESDAAPDDPGNPEATGDGGVGGMSATDLAWTQLMIPVNERLEPLLEALGERGDDPGLRAYATDLVPQVQEETTALRALLAEAGVAYEDLHRGHNMPGMVTEEELTALDALDGAAFDEEALAHLREFLEQTAEVSRSEMDAGTHPGTIALAADLDRVRTEQLAELERVIG
ncbi:DUF305 domain-containing protein [Streptomyces profundus]|uniref:DUF305 domain-containing protein n=1 Tax=Streptomyces profundus TaxID=2867410 RepID=UPI001D162EB5|nr:DUF305 domain-containing protein [Streptomyces sp. MA3_2.13]UED83701.1 DUF305 domain-containing protein [Streptomyces sp. MA3_2.13]